MSEPVRIRAEDRAAWLALRQNGIGGSEAAASVGYSPWKTPLELWREKAGQIEPKDISDKPEVAEGMRMEPALRAVFAARHPELVVEYNQFDLLHQPGRPELFATLDGEYWYKDAPEKRYVLEIKRASPSRKTDWEQWNDQVPQHYYLQILHQLLATDYAGATLFAALICNDGSIILKEYVFEREACEADLAWYDQQAANYWQYVKERRMPPQILRL